jgi:hypothetical protein
VNVNDLAAALRACAAGLYPLEAGTELLIANGTFLHRGDFTSRFTKHGTSDGIAMTAIDWDAAITALQAGQLPCSGGERRILQLSASLAGGIPVDLRDTLTGLDGANTARLLTAIRHATGRRADANLVLPRRHDGPRRTLPSLVLGANIVHVDIIDALKAIGSFGIERKASHIT